MSFTPQELKSIMGSGLLSFPVTDAPCGADLASQGL